MIDMRNGVKYSAYASMSDGASTEKCLFISRLEQLWSEKKFLCIGLDPLMDKIPFSVKSENVRESLVKFTLSIVDATADLVCAYKPNSAFYEAWGSEGMLALQEIIEYIHRKYDNIPVVLDAKRGDIGSTNEAYAKSAFEVLRADAITLQSYLGREAMHPFLKRKEKGCIFLVKTSNKGSGEFQDELLMKEGQPLYQVIARHIAEEWNENGNCCIVAGATYSEELQVLRKIVGDLPILIPGIGAQGGDISSVIRAARNSQNAGMIINSSRSILFAGEGVDYVRAARAEAEKMHQEMVKNLKYE